MAINLQFIDSVLTFLARSLPGLKALSIHGNNFRIFENSVAANG
jgi:hypothetical protein